MKRATIKDVAREAGVSMSTVNMALTGKKGISDELKKRVFDAVKLLDYKPNRVAGSLARSSIRIGIILPNDWEDYYNDICRGIEYEMGRLVDWKLEGKTLEYSVKDADTESQALSCFEELKHDGIKNIIFCHSNYADYKDALSFAFENDIRVVCIGVGKMIHRTNFLTIEVDAKRCGRIAAELLENSLPYGARVAIIIGDKKIWAHNEKVLGFYDRLNETGKIAPSQVLESGDDDKIAYNLTKEAIANGIEGFFIATGAVDGVCRAIGDSKKSIKVIATDCSSECRGYMDNGLIFSTIYQNTFFQGVTAVDTLYNYYVAGQKPNEQILVEPIVFTKESLLADNKKNIYANIM